jgi:replicative DNA helicase
MSQAIDSLLERKRGQELEFAASVLSNPKMALRDFGYIMPEEFSDLRVRKFWHNFVLDEDAFKAAATSDIIRETSQIIASRPDLTRVDVYADQFLRTGELVEITQNTQDITMACLTGDYQAALTSLDRLTTTHEKMLSVGSAVKTVAQVALNFVNRLNGGWDAIPTGYNKLDTSLGKLQRKQLSILASRTSIGKTALAFDIAFNAAAQKKKVIYFSTELNGEDLWARRASGAAGIDWRRVVSGGASPAELARVGDFAYKLRDKYEKYLFIDDESYTLRDIHRSTAALNPDFIIVDHLDELVKHRGSTSANRVEWLGEAVGFIRWLAKKYNCHSMVVHQLSRALESRESKVPVLSDLRGSGDIEQRADAIMLLHREDVYQTEQTPSLLTFVNMEVWIRKNRIGARDTKVDLNYDLTGQTFSEKTGGYTG